MGWGLRPGTDAALIAGMIHTMISEDLQDQDFLDTYVVGFDEDALLRGRSGELLLPFSYL